MPFDNLAEVGVTGTQRMGVILARAASIGLAIKKAIKALASMTVEL